MFCVFWPTFHLLSHLTSATIRTPLTPLCFVCSDLSSLISSYICHYQNTTDPAMFCVFWPFIFDLILHPSLSEHHWPRYVLCVSSLISSYIRHYQNTTDPAMFCVFWPFIFDLILHPSLSEHHWPRYVLCVLTFHLWSHLTSVIIRTPLTPLCFVCSDLSSLISSYIRHYQNTTDPATATALTVCLPAGRVKGPRYCIVHLSPNLWNGSGLVPLMV